MHSRLRRVRNEVVPAPARKPAQMRYWVLVGALAIILLLIGAYDEPTLAFLTLGWLKVLAALGLRQKAEAMQQGIDTGITKRLLPAVATYTLLYLGLCLLLLRVLLRNQAQWLLVLRLYAGTVAVYVAIVLLARLAGNAPWAYRLSRQILDFLVSPLPVAGLYVLMRTGFKARQEV